MMGPIMFNVWENDRLQLIALVPGETRQFSSGGRTDEGYSYEETSYHYDDVDNVVVCEYFTDGTDCDGRMSYSSTTACPVDQLMAREGYVETDAYGPGSAMPAWERLDAGQRDYSAEAMGY